MNINQLLLKKQENYNGGMIPLDFFTELSKACADRPFALLPPADQERYLSDLKTVVTGLLQKLEERQLTKTHGYYIASEMSKATEGEVFDEVRFAEALSHLDEMYGPWTKPELLEKVRYLDSFAEKFRAQVDEFYFAEMRVKETLKGLAPEAIEANDRKALETTGAFYIWEYTLILEQEMLKRSDAEKWKLLKDGLSVPAGNLPGLIPLMKSFRQELAFKLYNRTRRWQVLRIFFDFQAALDTNDLPTILKGLRKFHIELLTLAQDAGLKTFTGFIYKPYPDGTSYEDILKDLRC